MRQPLWCVVNILCIFVISVSVLTSPTSAADNSRLNNSVVANIYTIQNRAGCATDIKGQGALTLAAEWHANDVLDNRALAGDVGSDGSTAQVRAHAAGYRGVVSETVAINPALAINGIEILRRWYYRPDYFAIMTNCANRQIGVWSVNSLDRSVVVAVYGIPS